MRTVLIAIIIAATSAVASAEELKAGRQTVLRKERISMSPEVAKVDRGQALPVLERVNERSQKWIRSQSQGKEGWVTEADLKAPSGFDLSKMSSTVSGSAQANAAGEAAAAKGVEPITLAYAGGKNYDTSGLDRLMNLRATIINSGEFEKFAKEGNVGAYRK